MLHPAASVVLVFDGLKDAEWCAGPSMPVTKHHLLGALAYHSRLQLECLCTTAGCRVKEGCRVKADCMGHYHIAGLGKGHMGAAGPGRHAGHLADMTAACTCSSTDQLCTRQRSSSRRVPVYCNVAQMLSPVSPLCDGHGNAVLLLSLNTDWHSSKVLLTKNPCSYVPGGSLRLAESALL